MSPHLPAWSRLLLAFTLIVQAVLPTSAAFALPIAASTETVATLPPHTSDTVVPAATSGATVAPAVAVALQMTADPCWIEPGGAITYTVAVANTRRAHLADLALTDTLPDGLVYVAQSAQGFTYSIRDRRLTWDIPELAAGATLTGSFQARVQGLALGATVTNTVTATVSGPAEPVSASAAVDIVSPRGDETWVTRGQGGLLRSADDRVLLRVPSGAVGKRTRFSYAPVTDAPNPPPGLRFAFSLQAVEESGGAVRQFLVPLELTVADNPGQTIAPRLLYYDEIAGYWRGVPTATERGQRQLRAHLDHLTLFVVASSNCSGSICPEMLPSLRGAHHDLFSGAANIDYPIPLPAGAGGFTPSLALQFNSRSRKDDAGNSSVLGTGWKLSADSFIYWTPFLMGTPGKVWRIDGVSYTEGGGFLKEAPDWRIGYNGTGADAYAPDGRHYHFERALSDWVELGYWRTDKWVLQSITSPSGNRIEYVYDSALPVDPGDVNVNYVNYADGLGKRYRKFVTGNDVYRYLSQINLKQIKYNFDATGAPQTIIEFEHMPRYDAPDPMCQPDNEDEPSLQDENWKYWYYFTTRLLSAIRVRQQGQVVTDYKLDYDVWGWGCAHTMRYALKRITVCSNQALTNCLPATEFSNQPQNSNDSGKLVQTDNGYGGQVSFGYHSAWDWAVLSRTVTNLGQADIWSYEYLNPVISNYAGQSTTVGFTDVTETLPTSLGSGNTNTHRFLAGNDDVGIGLRGKENLQTLRRSGVIQQEVERNWLTTLAYTGGNLAYLAQEDQRIYNSDGLSYQTRRTKYFYDAYWQNFCGGGGQFGNATRIEEWTSATDATPYRTTLKGYCPNMSAWIVNKPGFVNLYIGAVPDPPAVPDATAIADATWYIYADEQDNPDPAWNRVVGSKGQLRGVRRYNGKDTSGSLLFVDTRYRHDPYGNPTHETTYANFGSASVWAAFAPRTTVTTYDTTLHVYPFSKTLPPTTDGLQFTTSYKYYALNADPGGFGLFGQLQSETDPNGAITRYSYDAWGRLQKVIRPGDSEDKPTIYHAYYDDVFNVRLPFLHATWQKTEQNAAPFSSGGTWVREFYDGLGQLIETQTPYQDWTPAGAGQEVVRFNKYNALGLKTSEATPYLKPAYVYTPNCQGSGRPCNPYAAPDDAQPKTQTTYDGLGRVTQVTQPDNQSSTMAYHVEQNTQDPDFVTPRVTVYTIDANQHFVRRAYDAFGNLRVVSQASGVWPTWGAEARTRYTYDAADRLTQVTGADGAVTTPSYNLLGQKTQTSDPDMGTWRYGYDTGGSLTRQTDAKDQRICFYYDNLHRLKGKTYSTGSTDCSGDPNYAGYAVKHYYDKDENGVAVANGLGRRTVMSDGSGNARWSYDARGRVLQETKVISGAGGGAFVTQWGYDPADRVATQTYPGGNAGQIGESVSYGYNAQGLPKTVSGASTYVGETLYNALGQATERRLGSAAGVVKQLYDYPQAKNYRLGTLQAGANSPSYNNRQDATYTYDNVGNLLTISDAAAYGGSQTQTFTYDFLNRLSAAQASGASAYGGYAQRSYGYGNTGNLTTFEGSAFTYQDAAHKHAVTHIGGVQKYGYDANGSATTRITGAQHVTLSYDAENRLTGIAGDVTASYVYDGDGQRVKETRGGTTTVYIGAIYEQTGATIRKYYYAGGTRVAENSGGTLYFLLGDHLGSTALTLDSAGNRLNTNTELRYFPYGLPRYTAGTTPTSFNFTGQRGDSGSGLLFYNARWYDPVVGRFLQADTIVPEPGDPQSLNRYSYTRNNPIRYTDPTGHAQACAEGDYGGGCGINTLDAEQVFWHAAKIAPELAEYYAIRAQYTRDVFAGASDIVLEAGWGTMENARLRGQAALPQAKFDPAILIDPGSAAGLAQIGGSIVTEGVILAIGRLSRSPVQAGEAGSFAELQARGLAGDNLEVHHIPQKALGRTSPEEGGALVMPKAEHTQTRTYGQRGALTMSQDAARSFRDVLAADLHDVRAIVGGRYNEGLRDLINYYRSNFPWLMQK